MREAPTHIRVTYEPLAAGLISAVSDDLRGFRIVGKSRDDLHREGPIVAKALVSKLFGIDCSYRWVDPTGARLAKEPAFAELVCCS